ncbi:MAG: N-acetyl-gamma-glutamyl-phosphate reductase [Burkholderiaceae bacterium]
MQDKLRVGIVGGTGYTGVELLRLLSQHPAVELVTITSRKDAGTHVAEMFSSLRGRVDLRFEDPASAPLTSCQIVFFATPHGVAMAQARELLAAGVRIIDLAADFRLQDPALFERWYKMPHACPDLLAEAVYGLPETNRAAIAKARIVGMAGCYPTSIQLGLLPLLELEARKPGSIEVSTLISDSKSGVSGAGRKAEVSLLAAEAADNFKAYGVAGHRHHPEIVQQLEIALGGKVGFTFVPHLVPMIRGILSTIYVRLKDVDGVDFQALYEQRYANEPFVDVMPAGSQPETRSVRGSNFARIALHRPGNGDLLVVLVVEDNLVKGAAGQSVQVMNIMAGRPEAEGLGYVALVP